MNCTISTDLAWEKFCNNNYKNLVTDCANIKGGKVIPKPSDIYISTQTKIAFLNQGIDLKEIFWKLPIILYQTKGVGIIKKLMK